jgi:hypothetical protein
MFGGSSKRNVASLGDVKIQAANEGGTIGFDPDLYIKGSNQKTINVGSGAAAKRYAVAYKKEGSGNFTVKQINKVVQSAGLGGLSMLLGARDQLTGVKPSSQEGKMVINSVALSQHFKSESGGNTGKLVGPIKVNVDPQADIYWAYKKSYNSHYNMWRNRGESHKLADEYARKAVENDFAIARKGASWKAGSKEGMDVALKQVEVGSSSSQSSPAAPPTTSEKPSDFALNFAVLGDPSIKKPKSNAEKASAASFISNQKDSLSKVDESKNVLAKEKQVEKTSAAISPLAKPTGSSMPMGSSMSSASIAPTNKPKQNIPQPPSNKPTIAAIPIPTKNKTPMMSGVSNGGSNNLPTFSSYRQEEPTLAVVASIYNMWGGL